MNKKLFILILLCVSCPLGARKQRKLGSIAQALNGEPANLLTTDFATAVNTLPSTKQAAIDKLSTEFESEPGEGQEPQAALPSLGTTVSTEKALEEVSPEQYDYSLPIELQKIEEQKAKTALLGLHEAEQQEEKIELQFEDADLQNFVDQIAHLFNITFISEDNIDPLPQGTTAAPVKAIKGNKITFKTNNPLSRKEAWDLFVSFLDIAGFAIVPQPDPAIYRIQTNQAARTAPVPTYIGVNYTTLPDNDQLIRYIYFVENANIDSLKPIIDSLVSKSAGSPILLKEHKAFILTDRAYNIKSLMQIVKELDKVTMPQAMSVLKLRQVDAGEVKKLYDELTQQGDNKQPFRPFGARKQSTALYFPENARIIAEPRTNSLILLGPQDAIAKIEEFVTKYIDIDLDQPYSPLHTYQLQYADAKAVAGIMNSTTKFGQNTEAGKSGGVRGNDKYLKQMLFTPEPSTNQLIIKGDYEDFLLAKNVLDELDRPQPQVALEVLILSVALQDQKELGSQIRSKVNDAVIPALKDLLGKNTVFQTSGLRVNGVNSGLETNNEGAGFQRLLGNLLKLVTNAGAGNTVVTFGQDLFGVWGLFKVLRTITSLEVISNPFLIASNQTPAIVSLGETRRVVASRIFAGSNTTENSFADDSANLTVQIRPQINSDGMIILSLKISSSEFTNPNDPSSGNKQTREIKTEAILADREVLALGGLVRETISEGLSKTPILGDIPLIGWLFKNNNKTVQKSSILVLISTKIIPPFAEQEINEFTQQHIKTYDLALNEVAGNSKDPIHKLFFEQPKKEKGISDLIFERHGKERPTRRGRGKRRKKESVQNAPEPTAIAEKPKAAIPEPVQPAAIPIQAPPPQNLVAEKLAGKKRSSQSLTQFLSSSDHTEAT